MPASRRAHRISLLLALAILSLSGFGATQQAVPVCGDLPKSYQPIIAFEMVRSVADLQQIFGVANDACRIAITRHLNTINWVDVFVYIPLYASFLIFFLLALRERQPAFASFAIGLVAVACLADYVENASLFQLAKNPDRSSVWLSVLVWATEIKWIGLGAVGAIAGYLLGLHRKWIARLGIIPCSVGLVVALATIPYPQRFGPLLSPALALGWLIFLLVNLRESFRSTSATRLV